MATITSKEIIRTILENGGMYPGDPQCARVYEYTSMNNETVYSIFMDYRHDDIHSSPFAIDPILLFDKAFGLTTEGKTLVKEKIS
jgi:hypothetical protein